MTAEAIVIIGATGDLAQRMLFPSLYFLDSEGSLPENFRIVGASRSDHTNEAFAALVEASVRERAGAYFNEKAWAHFCRRLSYCVVDASKPPTFQNLTAPLKGAHEVIFYLSTSPSLYEAISANLKASEVAKADSRVIVEKPIGHDLASCQEINDALARAFDEREIFRIDHYLGKETVQNLIAVRFANAFFEPLWNHVSIDHVQITVGETVGVEGRWGYYNDFGALREVVVIEPRAAAALPGGHGAARQPRPGLGAERKGQGAQVLAPDRRARRRKEDRARPVPDRRRRGQDSARLS